VGNIGGIRQTIPILRTEAKLQRNKISPIKKDKLTLSGLCFPREYPKLYLRRVSGSGCGDVPPLAPSERLQLREKVPEDDQVLRVRGCGIAGIGTAQQDPSEAQPVHFGETHIQLRADLKMIGFRPILTDLYVFILYFTIDFNTSSIRPWSGPNLSRLK